MSSAPHPGELIRDRIKALGMTQEDFGKRNKGLHWVTLNRLIKGHEKINVQYAMVIAKWFSTTPEYWLHLQVNYDLHIHRLELADPNKCANGRSKITRAKQVLIIARTRVFE